MFSRCRATASEVSPVNGVVPVSSSYRSTPAEYTSEAGVTSAPVTCSGER